ncbi:hypothetical protein CP965_06880 [Halarcobacter mediterraneus]|uniref:Uncharacterized protein n=1 Tax=Halarcobacter mediterraneus TaxID=2023153 RepID=A0A4Q1AWS1_9BACT|nr:hypothetical protein [Halarcobacter mediterraneus]RXK13521.1 hypothetical protein CP965_06880 [Halarcobacter mediterraneus]
MIIYIYGSDSFKKEINEVLKHSNIKFRLDSHGEIKELNSLNQLKDAIEENPNNIYLIDDSKIIKKNPLTDKIKFLRPKGGIEQEYLLDHGIGDVSVDSIDELSKHIVRRLDAVIKKDEENIDDIQNSIVEIVENAYDEDSNLEESNSEVIELDDELSALLSSSKDDDTFFEEEENKNQLSPEEEIEALLNQVEEVNENDFVENKSEEVDPSADIAALDALLGELEESDNEEIKEVEVPSEIEELNDKEELNNVLNQIEEHKINDEDIKQDELKDLSFDNNLDNIKIDEVEIKESSTQGDKMADEFSEFDTLSENEILEALNDLDNVTVSHDIKETNKNEIKAEEKTNNNVDLSDSSTEDIAKLISQLLNNKTLEITIKVKE